MVRCIFFALNKSSGEHTIQNNANSKKQTNPKTTSGNNAYFVFINTTLSLNMLQARITFEGELNISSDEC